MARLTEQGNAKPARPVPPKRRGSLDKHSGRFVARDTGRPAAIAAGTTYVGEKICLSAGGEVWEVWKWFMHDATINGWVIGGLICVIAIVFKWYQGYPGSGKGN